MLNKKLLNKKMKMPSFFHHNPLNQSIISIDIGTFSTKLVQGKLQNSNIVVEKAISIPTPPNAYDDGNILSMERLSEALRQAILANGLNSKKAVCTLGSTSTILREIVLPYTRNEDLSNMVHYEIENYLPIMLDEYVIEHKVIEEFEEDNARKMTILVAAMPKKIVEGYLELLNRLNLQPHALDIHTNGVSKFFDKGITINNESYSLNKTVSLIDLGHNFIHIHIISNGQLRFSRIIQHGGKDIDNYIANAFNLSLVEAADRKISISSSDKDGRSHSSSAMIHEIIQSNLDSWAEEMQKIFQYYTSRASGNRLDGVYLYGGSAHLDKIAPYLEEKLYVPTHKIERFSNIRFMDHSNEENFPEYLNAIAALIRR